MFVRMRNFLFAFATKTMRLRRYWLICMTYSTFVKLDECAFSVRAPRDRYDNNNNSNSNSSLALATQWSKRPCDGGIRYSSTFTPDETVWWIIIINIIISATRLSSLLPLNARNKRRGDRPIGRGTVGRRRLVVSTPRNGLAAEWPVIGSSRRSGTTTIISGHGCTTEVIIRARGLVIRP